MNDHAPRLHLPPRSSAAQRRWHTGSAGVPAAEPGLRLAVRPGDPRDFASLATILEQLRPRARPGDEPRFRKLDGFLRDAGPQVDAVAHRRLMADSVTFAIMRRISRESVYTARTIDLAARLVDDVLASLQERVVHVAEVDRLDRLTLKVLARAALLLGREHGFAWVWWTASDPTAADGDADSAPAASRKAFLRQLVGILRPTLVRDAGAGALGPLEDRPEAVSLREASTSLVLQNYDACLLWCERLASEGGEGAAEAWRLLGLALANGDRFDAALTAWERSATEAPGAAGRAHLCYLAGLVEAKRRYDLSTSEAHYHRGLEELKRGGDRRGDPALERAWLLNGLALNRAILGRREGGSAARFREAFERVHAAFGLVRDGVDPARVYLRYNLLANSAFLLETQGEYRRAIEVLERSFDLDVASTETSRHRLRSTLAYRIGVLHYREGDLVRAASCLAEAADHDARVELWSTRERILRAQGAVALEQGAHGRAAELFEAGLALCRDARSAEGTREHGRGLLTALLSLGAARRVSRVREALQEEDGIVLGTPGAASLGVEDVSPSPPSPKLPAYIPDVDLEGIPVIDLNRYLGRAPLREEAARQPWKA